jgi:hypothetical protein
MRDRERERERIWDYDKSSKKSIWLFQINLTFRQNLGLQIGL